MSEIPGPAKPLGEALSIALDPTVTDLALRRAELLLAIARELREDAQHRRMLKMAESPPPIVNAYVPPPPAADIEANLRKFAARFRAGADPVMSTAAEKADIEQTLADAGTLQAKINRAHLDAWTQARPEPSVDAGVTQQMPVIWTGPGPAAVGRVSPASGAVRAGGRGAAGAAVSGAAGVGPGAAGHRLHQLLTQRAGRPGCDGRPAGSIPQLRKDRSDDHRNGRQA